MIIAFQVGVVKIDKSFFLEWTNNVNVKIDERMSHLTNELYTNKHRDCLSSPDVKNALDNIYKDFVAVPIDNATGNIAFVCQRFYAFYNNIGGLSANNIIGRYKISDII